MSVRWVCSCGQSKLAGNPQDLLNLSFFSSLTHSEVLFLWGLVKSFHTVLERCVTSLAADRHRKLPGEMKEMNPWEQEGRKGWGRDSRVAVFLLFFFSDFHCLPKIFSGQEMVCEESLEAVERGGRSSRLGVWILALLRLTRHLNHLGLSLVSWLIGQKWDNSIEPSELLLQETIRYPVRGGLAPSRCTALSSPEESEWWVGARAIRGYEHEIFFEVQWRVFYELSSWLRPIKLIMGRLMTVLINHGLPRRRHFHVEGSPGLALCLKPGPDPPPPPWRYSF